MKFEIGALVSLGDNRYRIREHLGSGAVSDVYLAVPEMYPSAEVIVKVVRHEVSEDVYTLEKNIEGLQTEIKVLKILNAAEDPLWNSLHSFSTRLRRSQETALQRRIVALCDSGFTPEKQPFAVQEKAPKEMERFDIANLADERKMLSVAQALADALVLIHGQRMALKDFDPDGYKGDRLRLRWLEQPGQFELKIIDWNITGGPEDIAQDLFFFGRHLYYFFLGSSLVLDEQNLPPARLSMISPHWDLTEGTQHILRRLLHRDTRRRYQQASDLKADLDWWLETLNLADTLYRLSRLQDRLWQARSQGHHHRAWAVARLALRLEPPPEIRQSFEEWERQAREELEKDDLRPLAGARATLLTGAYEKAAGEFNAQIGSQPPESETARLARIFHLLAQAGGRLKRVTEGADIRNTSEWMSLSQGVTALVDRRWSDANRVLRQAMQQRSELEQWEPVKALVDLSSAYLLLQEAAALVAEADPHHIDPGRPDWIEFEKRQINQLQEAVNKLGEANNKASYESEIRNQFELQQTRLKQRSEFLAQYESIEWRARQGEEAFGQGREDYRKGSLEKAIKNSGDASEHLKVAREGIRGILKKDALQPRARLLESKLESSSRENHQLWQTATDLYEARNLMVSGEYSTALEKTDATIPLMPADPEILSVQQEARGGELLVRRAGGMLTNAREYIKIDNLKEAKDQIEMCRSWQGKPFGDLLDRKDLPPEVRGRPFRLPASVSAEADKLGEEVSLRLVVHDGVEKALKKSDYLAVLTELQRLIDKGLSFTKREEDWFNYANRMVSSQKKIEAILAGPPDFEALAEVLDSLRDDSSARTAEERERAAYKWREWCEALADFDEARRRLDEGSRVFRDADATVRKMEDMRALADQKLLIRQHLNIAEGQWPAWFGTSGWGGRLLELKKASNDLRERGWPVIKQAATERYQQLTQGFLPGFLQNKLDEAARRTRERLPTAERAEEEVLSPMQRIWEEISETLRSDLPEGLRDRFEKYLSALKARIQARDALGALVNDIKDGRRSFDECEREARQVQSNLPNHADVPVTDLSALIDDMLKAADIERASNQVPDGVTTYAPLIADQRRLAAEELPALPNRLSFAVREQAKKAVWKSVENLFKALREEADALPERLNPDSQSLLALDRQVRWWQVVRNENELDGKGAYQAARETPRRLLDKIASLLHHMQAVTDLKTLQTWLTHLIKLNRELNQPPSNELPPLPPEKKYEENEPVLEPTALDDFSREIAYLIELDIEDQNWRGRISEQNAESMTAPEQAGELAPLETTAAQYEVRQVESMQNRLRQLQQHLEDLIGKIWRDLKLETPPNDSSLMKLREEIEVHASLLTPLTEAHRLLTDKKAMAGLGILEPRHSDLGRLDGYPLWLLSGQRLVLKGAFNALRQDLIAALGEQVADILKRPTAVKDMQKEVLCLPRGEEVAIAARQAIREEMRNLSKKASRSEVRAWWKIVMDATAPWAEGATQPPKSSVSSPPPVVTRKSLTRQKGFRIPLEKNQDKSVSTPPKPIPPPKR